MGITAVLMLIIGGFKYLTAAGNPAAATEGKEIVRDAGFGLILALLSWVIVSTINPDVLYIKQPGTGSSASYNPKCTTSAPNDDFCACNSGVTVDRDTYPTCDDACAEEGQCKTSTASCVKEGTNPIADDDGKCVCVDGTEKSVFKGTDCQGVCTDNCLVADARMIVFGYTTSILSQEDYLRSISHDGTVDDIYFVKKQDISSLDYILEGELFSNAYYKPVKYDWDLNLDGNYDGTSPVYLANHFLGSSTNSPELNAVLTLDPPYPTACYNIKEPQAIVCPMKFKIMDSMFPGGACSNTTHCKEDILYFGVEGDTFCKGSGLTCINNVDCCSNFCNPVGNICQDPL